MEITHNRKHKTSFDFENVITSIQLYCKQTNKKLEHSKMNISTLSKMIKLIFGFDSVDYFQKLKPKHKFYQF